MSYENYVLAVDIGGTTIKMGVVNKSEVIDSTSINKVIKEAVQNKIDEEKEKSYFKEFKAGGTIWTCLHLIKKNKGFIGNKGKIWIDKRIRS